MVYSLRTTEGQGLLREVIYAGKKIARECIYAFDSGDLTCHLRHTTDGNILNLAAALEIPGIHTTSNRHDILYAIGDFALARRTGGSPIPADLLDLIDEFRQYLLEYEAKRPRSWNEINSRLGDRQVLCKCAH